MQTPKKLNRYAKKQWDIIIPYLEANNLITPLDIPTLEDAFYAYGVAIKIRNLLEKEYGGIENYLKDKNSQTATLYQEYKANIKKYNEVMYKFGSSAIERQKINMKPKDTISDREQEGLDALSL